MSRGHGTVQRRILEELTEHRWVSAYDLAAGPTRSAVVSVQRALHRLSDEGLVMLQLVPVGSTHVLYASKRCTATTTHDNTYPGRLGPPNRLLAWMLGVSEATVRRMKQGQPISAKLDARIKRFDRDLKELAHPPTRP